MIVFQNALPTSGVVYIDGGIAWVKAKVEGQRQAQRMVSLYVIDVGSTNRKWFPPRHVFSRTYLPENTPKEELEETLAQMFLMVKAAHPGAVRWNKIAPRIYSKSVKDLTS